MKSYWAAIAWEFKRQILSVLKWPIFISATEMNSSLRSLISLFFPIDFRAIQGNMSETILAWFHCSRTISDTQRAAQVKEIKWALSLNSLFPSSQEKHHDKSVFVSPQTEAIVFTHMTWNSISVMLITGLPLCIRFLKQCVWQISPQFTLADSSKLLSDEKKTLLHNLWTREISPH